MIIKKAKVVHLNELDGISVAIARTEDGERQLSFRNDKGYEVGREVEVQFDDDYNGFNVVGWCGCPSCTMKRQNDGYVDLSEVSKADLVEQIREVYRQNYEAKTRTPDEKALDAALTDYTGKSVTIGKKVKELFLENNLKNEPNPFDVMAQYETALGKKLKMEDEMTEDGPRHLVDAYNKAQDEMQNALGDLKSVMWALERFTEAYIEREGSAVDNDPECNLRMDWVEFQRNYKAVEELLDTIKPVMGDKK